MNQETVVNNKDEAFIAKLSDRILEIDKQKGALGAQVLKYKADNKRLRANNRAGLAELKKLNKIIDRLVDNINSYNNKRQVG